MRVIIVIVTCFQFRDSVLLMHTLQTMSGDEGIADAQFCYRHTVVSLLLCVQCGSHAGCPYWGNVWSDADKQTVLRNIRLQPCCKIFEMGTDAVPSSHNSYSAWYIVVSHANVLSSSYSTASCVPLYRAVAGHMRS
jgi:hypothetical protein